MLKKMLGTFGVRAASIGLSFLIGLLLARILGAASYGIYTIAFSWLSVLIVPVVFGFDRLLIRDIAIYVSMTDWPPMRGLISFSRWWSLLIAGTLLAIAFLSISFLIKGQAPELSATLLFTLAALPLLAICRLRQAVLRGLGQPWMAEVPEAFIQPVFLSLALLLVWMYFDFQFPGAPFAAGLLLSSMVVSSLAGEFLLRRKLPESLHHVQPVFRRRQWLNAALPIFILAAVQAIHGQVDILVLGTFGNHAATGIYAAAIKGATLVAIALEISNITAAPHMARLHRQGKNLELQETCKKSGIYTFWFSLPILIFLAIKPEIFLSLFGEEFEKGASALSILAMAQFANIATGPLGIVLLMTGHERDSLRANFFSMLVTSSLCLLLIPGGGIEGAAWARSGGIVVSNLYLAFLVHRRLGFLPHPF